MPANVEVIDRTNINTNPKTYRVVLATEASKITRDYFNHAEMIYDAARAQGDGISTKMAKLNEEKNDIVTRRHLTLTAHGGRVVPKETIKVFDDEIAILKAEMRALEGEQRIRGVQLGELISYITKRHKFTVPDDLPTVDEFEATEDMLLEVRETKTGLRKELGKAEFFKRDNATILANALAELDAAEKAGALNLDELARPHDQNQRTGLFEISRAIGSIGWPMQFARRGDDATVFNSRAFAVWLHRAEIEKRLRAMIEKMPEGITAEEKVARVADLHEKIAATLRREHAVLVALEKRGNLYLRKESYHPAILLGLTAPARLIAQHTV